MNVRSTLRAALGVALALGVAAVAAGMAASNEELDARVRALAQQIRCVVCQNQTLADSNAELAVDLRQQMRSQLAAGADERAVKEFLVQRYGDFVLYKPPLKPVTWFLWFGPLLLLVLVIAFVTLSRRSRAGEKSPTLDARELEQLDAVLHGTNGDMRP